MRWLVVLLVMAGVINPACGCGEVLGSDCHTVAAICEHADEHSEEPCDHDHESEHTQPRGGAQLATLKVPPASCQDLPLIAGFLLAELDPALLENNYIRLAARELDDDVLSAWPPLRRHCALLL